MGPQEVEYCDPALLDWPAPWIPGQPKPPRNHNKYFKAKERALRRVHPPIRSVHGGNELWNRIVQEHNEDVDFWLYDDEPHPQDTEEWKYLNQLILPKVMMALERTCRLLQALQASEGENRIFSFCDSFVYFLMNTPGPGDASEEKNKTSVKPPDCEGLKYTTGEKKSYAAAINRLKKTPNATYKPSLLRGEHIPKYKIMSRNKAAKVIQKHVRGWLVRKEPHIQDMRQFWKVMRDTQYKEVVVTDSKIIFKEKARKKPAALDDFFIEPRVLERILGADMYVDDEELVKSEKPKRAETKPVDDCIEPLGLEDQSLNSLTKEEIEDLLRIYSMQPDLRKEAMKVFLTSLKSSVDNSESDEVLTKRGH